MTEELTLYHFAEASSFASNVVLAWTGQKANAVKPTSIDAYDKQINPAAAVPSLVLSDGVILTQSPAILNYIAKKANRIDLIGGDDLIDQAQVLKWSSFLASDVHASFWIIFFTDRYTTSTDPEALAQVKAAGVQVVTKKLSIIEKHMTDRLYLVTDHKTIVDAHLFAFMRWTTAHFTDMMNEFPNLKSFAERMTEDEGVQAAMYYEDKEKWGM